MEILIAIGLIVSLLFSLLFPLILLGGVWALAQMNVLFTDCKEGRAKVLMYNKQFRKCIMTYSGHKFRGDTELRQGELNERRGYIVSESKPSDADTNPAWVKIRIQKVYSKGDKRGETYTGDGYRRRETDDEVRSRIDPHEWDVVRLLTGETEDVSSLSELPLVGGFLSNIYWIGIWPFGKVYDYNMRWVSWDYPHDSTSVTSSEKQPLPHQERIDYILVQEDIYWAKISKAETREGVPVDVSLLLTLASSNPYKSLFKVERWVEATTNQAEADTREFVGQLKFEQLFGDKTATAEMLNDTTLQELRRFRHQYGINAKLVQIQSIDPAGERGQKYRELSTKKYEAEREAEAREIKAKAEETWINKTEGTQANIQKDLHRSLGPEGYKALNMGRLKTYVEGDSGQKKAVIAVSDDGE